MVALDLIIVVPLLLAMVCAFASRSWPEAPRWIALAAVAAQMGLLGALAPSGVFSGARVAGADLGAAGAVWSVGTDGLSTPLLVLTVFIGLMAVSASWRVSERTGAHFGLLLLLQAAVSAVFLAENVILFYVAWESVLFPMFLLIAGWGSSNARKASMKFLVYTFAGGALLLIGLLVASISTQSLSIDGMIAGRAGIGSPQLVFWLMAAAFLIKLPVVPVHTWLPDAHTEAPTAGSIVLAGVLLKMGGYGLMRVALPLAPSAFASGRTVLAALGVIGIIWGAATALVQTDLKRLVAYSSVAHMGFVVLAISTGLPDAMSAALLTMVSHGFVAAMLFYLVGALYERAHTRELSRFGGLGAVTPRWAVAFVFASLASAGLPALSGFPGEFVTILEAYSAWGWTVIVAGLGVVLAAAYNLRAVRSSVQGPVGEFGELADLDIRQSATSVLFATGYRGPRCGPLARRERLVRGCAQPHRPAGGGSVTPVIAFGVTFAAYGVAAAVCASWRCVGASGVVRRVLRRWRLWLAVLSRCLPHGAFRRRSSSTPSSSARRIQE